MTDDTPYSQAPETPYKEASSANEFASQYQSNFPKILEALGISLVVSSYQSDSLILIRSKQGELNTSIKHVKLPMGLCVSHERVTVSSFNKVTDFKVSHQSRDAISSGQFDDMSTLSKKIQPQTEQNSEHEFYKARAAQINAVKACDMLFTERTSLTTGFINIHDIAWGDDGLWAVNSSYSCLVTLSPNTGFVAKWKPPFISELKPDNRCHLNGMAMLNGKPRYVTTFSQCDSKDAWRENTKGTLIDVNTNEILLDNLCLPHSPRCHEGWVYVCNSGEGQVLKYNPISKKVVEVCTLPGFTRGLTFLGDLMIVCTSTTKETKVSGKTTILHALQSEKTRCGIWVLNKHTGEVITHLEFTENVSQLYDIAVISNSTFPEFIGNEDALSPHLFDFLMEIK
ncbi:TIGR03032 family protein [Pseudoalteromonas luteoviolacea]|uniref:Conserved hypothetical protein CHP03032 domain-containing protein n=1 Tax=Pseudoalteromonas luteoviolacea S4054 TaxID=1129367 RepID=A0A0F6AGW4_9GAMM|nr:TIGR03032 family protein [Pseudoalteromonas luteoviolacea]AOT08850.1 hypothetical protein S4054249_13730 [Pseudoalteromonas luteoviolacea]AOT13763.1 hypothetical protein S40542_13700 [Pseudoalteromonas luteoviolacea]AOT18677.1 hypothetical protein S4054_13705 [Pseudoalteromonas luteoviolacea]KKE85460.1 hypothetical protein N479_25975 [Pseudoalteromonas luteoviolacea S4054]KZN67974.1 hypothetical protein N481_23325 [Pseudoalteromonas luteoviolacea S4047-1]